MLTSDKKAASVWSSTGGEAAQKIFLQDRGLVLHRHTKSHRVPGFLRPTVTPKSENYAQITHRALRRGPRRCASRGHRAISCSGSLLGHAHGAEGLHGAGRRSRRPSRWPNTLIIETRAHVAPWSSFQARRRSSAGWRGSWSPRPPPTTGSPGARRAARRRSSAAARIRTSCPAPAAMPTHQAAIWQPPRRQPQSASARSRRPRAPAASTPSTRQSSSAIS